MNSPLQDPVTTPNASLFIGAAWYPEHWDRATAEEDMRLMVSLGMNVVRVAEFAWSRLEPKEGIYELSWLHEALDLAHASGINVVLGTPTPTPPAWLLKKYPDIGYQDEDGYRHRHGSRQHACYNNPIFREYGRKITEVVARELGKHPAVVAWQTDNELRGHQKICTCPSCHKAWAKWLEKRYGTVEELNKIWGTHIWSNHYDSFEDVPQMYRLCCWSHHFSLVTNYKRFMSDTAVEFQNEHAEIIRAHSPHPITHNSEESIDEWDLFRNLDFAGIDLYPRAFTRQKVQLRIDSMRTLKPGRRYWTMETGCDSGEDDRQKPGQVPYFGFLSYVSGSQAIMYWCWRQNRTGTEIQHATLLYSDGQPTPDWQEVAKVSETRKKLEPILRDYSPAPAEVAIVRSESNARYFFNAGLEAGFSYLDRISGQYATLAEVGAWRDVIDERAPLDSYKIVFTPYLPYVSSEFLQHIEAVLNRGGAWVVGPYAGFRERDHTIPTNAILGQVEKMLGFKTKYFAQHGIGNISFAAGFQGKGEMYSTVFEPGSGDEVLGTYIDGAYKDLTWGISRAFGKGRVYVLGSEVDSRSRALLFAKILDREKIERVPLHASISRVPQVKRDGGKAWALCNAEAATQEIVLPGPGRDLLTGQSVGKKTALPGLTNAFIAFD